VTYLAGLFLAWLALNAAVAVALWCIARRGEAIDAARRRHPSSGAPSWT